jgi:hypothetical protein
MKAPKEKKQEPSETDAERASAPMNGSEQETAPAAAAQEPISASMRATVDTLWLSMVAPETAPDRKGLRASSLVQAAHAAAERLSDAMRNAHTEGQDGTSSMAASTRSTLVKAETLQKHAAVLSELSVDFAEDFARRREMVLCRLEATRHCFIHTAKAAECVAQLEAMYAQKVVELSSAPTFTTEDVASLSVHDATALLQPSELSAGLMRRFKMAGKVPDRGGRYVLMRDACVHVL